jgi:hypothetical protein
VTGGDRKAPLGLVPAERAQEGFDHSGVELHPGARPQLLKRHVGAAGVTIAVPTPTRSRSATPR